MTTSTERWRPAAQGVGKHTKRPSVTINGVKARAANPYVGLVPDPSKIDWAYWKSYMAKQAEKRYASLKPPTPFVRDEQEPEGTLGSNDSPATAEGIPRFGTAKRKHQAVRILGELSAPDIEAPDVGTTEDQGSITLATDTGIPADADGATITSEIGDGPHGEAGTGNGDFDFFKVTAAAGQTLTVNTAGSELDTVAAVWDSVGHAPRVRRRRVVPGRRDHKHSLRGPGRRRLLRDDRRLLLLPVAR